MMEREEQINIVESWINDISASLGVDLSLDSDGACFFQIGESTLIGIEVSSELPLVHLFSPVLSLPIDDTEDNSALQMLMARALELNAFQTLTRGGAIAITPGGGPLLFCFTTPIEGVDSEAFSKILGGFYETISEIKSLLTQSSTDDVPMPKEQTSPVVKKMMFIKV